MPLIMMFRRGVRGCFLERKLRIRSLEKAVRSGPGSRADISGQKQQYVAFVLTRCSSPIRPASCSFLTSTSGVRSMRITSLPRSFLFVSPVAA